MVSRDPAAIERSERRADARFQIRALEIQQCRALREAALGMDGAVERLRAIDEQIAKLRLQLKG